MIAHYSVSLLPVGTLLIAATLAASAPADEWIESNRRHCRKWESCLDEEVRGRAWNQFGKNELGKVTKASNPVIEKHLVEGSDPPRHRLALRIGDRFGESLFGPVHFASWVH